MAAAGFSNIPFSYLEPARAVIARRPWSPSPLHHNIKESTKEEQRKKGNNLEGRARPILFLA